MEYVKAMRKHPHMRRLKCNCPLSVQGVSGTAGVPGENAWPLTADFYDHAIQRVEISAFHGNKRWLPKENIIATNEHILTSNGKQGKKLKIN